MPETGQQVDVDTSSSKFRERYQAAAREKTAWLRHTVRAARAEFFDMTTAVSVVPQLVDFIEARQVRRARMSTVRAR